MKISKSYRSNVRSVFPLRKMVSISCIFVLALNVTACEEDDRGADIPTRLAANKAPLINSPAQASVMENVASAFYTVEASDPDGDILSAIEIIPSSDGRFFTLNQHSMQISPAVAFDFEKANDVNADNIYEISIRAIDSRGASTTFALEIAVKDVPDNFSYALQTGVAPSENFDLLDWKLDLPVNDAGELQGKSKKIDEDVMAAGYVNPDYFFTGPDGGMVMRSPSRGATTSTNTRYTRTELREMLRRGDRSISTRGTGGRPNGNNWAFSSAPQGALDDAGGIDGDLRVTMAVNEVTTTGENFQIGRVIIGQIHAKDDEPLRLYYRKLPDNARGSIYAVHEPAGGDDIRYDIIGSSSSSASDPANGILLGETFSYEVRASGNDLDILILKANGEFYKQHIDMTSSGYDVEDDFMYFKVGVYHVNDMAEDGEFAQVTIYELDNKHQNYPF